MKIPMPVDDPTWPLCIEDNCPNFGLGPDETRGWCNHVRDYLYQAKDATNIFFGTRVVVPISPVYDLYAEVSIDSAAIAGRFANLALVYEEDSFTNTEDLVPLGLYTKDEGRLVIANSIAAWISQFTERQCQTPWHNYGEEMEHQRMQAAAAGPEKQDWFKNHWWCLAYHQMCWPCFRNKRSGGANAPRPDGTVNNSADFGLSGVDEGQSAPRGTNGVVPPRRPAVNPADTLSALQGRFGR